MKKLTTLAAKKLVISALEDIKAHDIVAIDVAGNLNPLGRLYYSGSTFLCVPNALSQEGGYSLGAQAGEEPVRRLANDAGFTRFRRVAENPFNNVYEARP